MSIEASVILHRVVVPNIASEALTARPVILARLADTEAIFVFSCFSYWIFANSIARSISIDAAQTGHLTAFVVMLAILIVLLAGSSDGSVVAKSIIASYAFAAFLVFQASITDREALCRMTVCSGKHT